jgi:hypothetical protein
MPGNPFATPTSTDELWRNILYDMGAPSVPIPITLKDILAAFDTGIVSQSAATYGNASDGTVNFDGTTARLGLTPSSGVYTLNRDIYLANNSIVAAGATLECAGFRVFCNGNLIINGTIRTLANNAVTSTPGALLSYSGTISNTTVGTVGGAASTTTTGGAGTNGAANGLGGAGGTGGTESGGAGTPGAGGTVTAPLATVQGLNNIANALAFRVLGTTAYAIPVGGSGGGGGAGDGTNSSGAGGGGGGLLGLYCATVSGTGTVAARGGNGGAASATGNAGGGGGGGGGCIVCICGQISPTPPTITAGVTTIGGVTFTVAGGTGGAGNGTGAAGAAGSAGTMVLLSE